MKHKEWIIRSISLLLGIVIGIAATIGVWYYKENYQFKLFPSSQSEVKAFEDNDFWDKVVFHFEKEGSIFLNNYYSIYSYYLLYDYLDQNLLPYYEEYGYNTIIYSGLTSGNKMAEAYCVDKCTELYGDEKLNVSQLSKALNEIKIDEKVMTDNEEEPEYIKLATERLEIAKTIFSGTFDHDKVIKNDNGDRIVWIANSFYGNYKMRILDNGQFYTLEQELYTLPSNMKFLDNSVLLCEYKDEYSQDIQFISFSEKITVTDLEESIQIYLNEKDDSEEYVYADSIKIVGCDKYIVSGECECNGESNTFTIDTQKGKIITLELNKE